MIKAGKQNLKIRGNKLLVGEEAFSLKDLQSMEEEKKTEEPPSHLSNQSNSQSTPSTKRKAGRLPGSGKRQLSDERRVSSLDRFLSVPSKTKKAKQEE